MPVSPTYPGVYIEEIPSGVRTITGVATSITAFIGRSLRGPVNVPTRIQSFADFGRVFGGLWLESTMSYAVSQYFQHGGRDAIIVRVHKDASPARVNLPAEQGAEDLILVASSAGNWGNDLTAVVDHETKDPSDPYLFNLTINELDPSTIDEADPTSGEAIATEKFLNVSADPASARYVANVLAEESALVDVQDGVPVSRPDKTENTWLAFSHGDDGDALRDDEVTGDAAARTGIYALEEADLFNLLCIPPLKRTSDIGDTTLAAAAKYCKARRAMFIVDAPANWRNVADAESGVDTLRSAIGTDLSSNVAAYFPRLKMGDPLRENRTEAFAPCGAMAGVFARTDAQRGVWKAPAGIEASLVGVRQLSTKLTDPQNGVLNPKGLNSLRTFPVSGHVVWGARTLAGADVIASEWKYIPVRRVALYIEESLYRGTQWVVFEPNDEPLWAQIRLNVGAFMHGLFRRGAFQGTTPREAYLVKCDKETTTQADINRGVVNILVGFAPLKPAEFVIIQIKQLAGQIET